MTGLVAVPLPDGTWLALPAEELRAGLARGAALGLGANAVPATAPVAGQGAETG